MEEGSLRGNRGGSWRGWLRFVGKRQRQRQGWMRLSGGHKGLAESREGSDKLGDQRWGRERKRLACHRKLRKGWEGGQGYGELAELAGGLEGVRERHWSVFLRGKRRKEMQKRGQQRSSIRVICGPWKEVVYLTRVP